MFGKPISFISCALSPLNPAQRNKEEGGGKSAFPGRRFSFLAAYFKQTALAIICRG